MADTTVVASPVVVGPTDDEKLMFNVVMGANNVFGKRGTKQALSDESLPLLNKHMDQINEVFNTGMVYVYGSREWDHSRRSITHM